MPIVINDLNGGLGNIILGIGKITEEEFLQVFTEHLTQDPEKFKKYRFSLIDWTAALRSDISTEAIKKTAEECLRASRVNPNIVVAEVADDNFIYGMIRMSQSLRSDGNWENEAFRSRVQAEAWIRQRVLAKFGIKAITFE